MGAVEGLIAKLKANQALVGKPFAVVFKLTAKPGQEDVIRQTMQRILPLTRAEVLAPTRSGSSARAASATYLWLR